MVSWNEQRSSFLVLSVSVVVLFAGCVDLDKRNFASFGKGQAGAMPNYGKQDATQKAVGKIQDLTKSTGIASAVKDVWPFRRKAKLTVADQELAKNDPTRLDYHPKKVGPELHVASARVAERAGEYDVAMKQYGQALNVEPTNRNALIGLARLQHKIGKTPEAIQVYQRALQTHRNDPVIMNDLGICYAREKRLDSAIDVLSAATEAAPDREMYANNLAAVLVQANRLDEALKHLGRTRSPQVANYNIGYLLAQSGRGQEAADYLHRAVSIDPELRPARKLLDDLTPRVSALPENSAQTQPYQYSGAAKGQPIGHGNADTGYPIR